MIQVQNGRLHLNWLGRGQYPRYATIRPEFDQALAAFTAFVADEDLGEIRANQREITYVNQIPKGPLWSFEPRREGHARCL